MRFSLRPFAALVLAASLTGCASTFRSADADPEPPPRAPVAQAAVEASSQARPARVGLAATMDMPENPYGDTAVVDIPDPVDIASGAAPFGYSPDPDSLDPSDITVSRYYYQDEGTLYYEDVAADLEDDGQGYDDDVYYGGYDASYYRYSDPAYYPSPYTYYRPYATYRPYVHYGWYDTWHSRHRWGRGYGYYAGHYYDPWYGGYGYYDPWYSPGVYISVGYGWGGYGYGSYGRGYRDGYYAGTHSGYYGPGYYGRPRHRQYYDGVRGGDDGARGRVQAVPGRVAQSSPDPSRQPARRGLAPARLPRPSADAVGRGGITRSTGRSDAAPTRGWSPDRSTRTAPDRTTGGRTAAPQRTPGRTTAAPQRQTNPGRTVRQPSRTNTPPPERRTEERVAPRRTERPAPTRGGRADPPRRESRPTPAPRREETRPAPAPRRESRPAPAPRRESRPAPAPRRESSRPSRSRGGNNGSARPSRSSSSSSASRPSRSSSSRSSGSRRSSRRGGN